MTRTPVRMFNNKVITVRMDCPLCAKRLCELDAFTGQAGFVIADGFFFHSTIEPADLGPPTEDVIWSIGCPRASCSYEWRGRRSELGQAVMDARVRGEYRIKMPAASVPARSNL